MADSVSETHARSTYVGWRYETLVSDPGPPPRRPAPSEQAQTSKEWIASQRQADALTHRPLFIALGALTGIVLLCLLLWPLRILPGIVVLGVCLACLAVAAPALVALGQGRRVTRERLAQEQQRLETERREQEEELRQRQEEHARSYTEWQHRKRVYDAQPRWYGVKVPDSARLVVVAGGTDTGWSALATTIGASRLRNGGDLTVVDLSGRAVAGDLTSLVKRCAVVPRLWVLPADLPRMNLGTNLEAGQRAHILTSVARAFGAEADSEADKALLLHIFEVVGPEANIATVIGGLRALAAPESDTDTEDDPALKLLSTSQRKEIRERCGEERATLERAWELERRLSPFEGVGTRAADEPYAQVKVIATDRASGDVAARAYGTYTIAALSQLLELRASQAERDSGHNSASGEHAPTAELWAHTIIVCGADALPADEVEQLVSTAERAGAGLVLMFREAGAEIEHLLSHDDGFPVVMRQPDADSAARALARLTEERQSGTDDPLRIPIHRLTEVIGEALSDTVADSYVEDTAEGVTVPVAMRYAATSVAPLDLVRHLRSATVWGRTTSQAAEIGDTEDPGRLRDIRLDAHCLRNLPSTAILLPGDDGPLIADANPGVLTLPTATLSTVEEAPTTLVDAADQVGERVDAGAGPPPNLGPPSERLDWRSA